MRVARHKKHRISCNGPVANFMKNVYELIDFVRLKEPVRTLRTYIGVRRCVKGLDADNSSVGKMIDDQVDELELVPIQRLSARKLCECRFCCGSIKPNK